jgi:hypothetical protein
MAWHTVTQSEFLEHEAQHSADPLTTLNGWSPGWVAARLGVTRQALHNAIRRNTLSATRVLDDHSGKLLAIYIPQREIDHYEKHHLNWIGLRKTAQA